MTFGAVSHPWRLIQTHNTASSSATLFAAVFWSWCCGSKEVVDLAKTGPATGLRPFPSLQRRWNHGATNNPWLVNCETIQGVIFNEDSQSSSIFSITSSFLNSSSITMCFGSYFFQDSADEEIAFLSVRGDREKEESLESAHASPTEILRT